MPLPLKRRALAAGLVVVAMAVSLGLGGWHFYPTAKGLVTPVPRPAGSGVLFGPEGARVFRSQEELAAALPKAQVDVDFDRHDLVQVSWQATGYSDSAHPNETQFGKLTCRATRGGKQLIFFNHKEVAPGPVSSLFIRMPFDEWFLVPKGTDVRLCSGVSVDRNDWLFGLVTAVLLSGAGIATLRTWRPAVPANEPAVDCCAAQTERVS